MRVGKEFRDSQRRGRSRSLDCKSFRPTQQFGLTNHLRVSKGFATRVTAKDIWSSLCVRLRLSTPFHGSDFGGGGACRRTTLSAPPPPPPPDTPASAACSRRRRCRRRCKRADDADGWLTVLRLSIADRIQLQRARCILFTSVGVLRPLRSDRTN